jgi:hypothetical protein
VLLLRVYFLVFCIHTAALYHKAVYQVMKESSSVFSYLPATYADLQLEPTAAELQAMYTASQRTQGVAACRKLLVNAGGFSVQQAATLSPNEATAGAMKLLQQRQVAAALHISLNEVQGRFTEQEVAEKSAQLAKLPALMQYYGLTTEEAHSLPTCECNRLFSDIGKRAAVEQHAAAAAAAAVVSATAAAASTSASTAATAAVTSGTTAAAAAAAAAAAVTAVAAMSADEINTQFAAVGRYSAVEQRVGKAAAAAMSTDEINTQFAAVGRYSAVEQRVGKAAAAAMSDAEINAQFGAVGRYSAVEQRVGKAAAAAMSTDELATAASTEALRSGLMKHSTSNSTSSAGTADSALSFTAREIEAMTESEIRHVSGTQAAGLYRQQQQEAAYAANGSARSVGVHAGGCRLGSKNAAHTLQDAAVVWHPDLLQQHDDLDLVRMQWWQQAAAAAQLSVLCSVCGTAERWDGRCLWIDCERIYRPLLGTCSQAHKTTPLKLLHSGEAVEAKPFHNSCYNWGAAAKFYNSLQSKVQREAERQLALQELHAQLQQRVAQPADVMDEVQASDAATTATTAASSSAADTGSTCTAATGTIDNSNAAAGSVADESSSNSRETESLGVAAVDDLEACSVDDDVTTEDDSACDFDCYSGIDVCMCDIESGMQCACGAHDCQYSDDSDCDYTKCYDDSMDYDSDEH